MEAAHPVTRLRLSLRLSSVSRSFPSFSALFAIILSFSLPLPPLPHLLSSMPLFRGSTSRMPRLCPRKSITSLRRETSIRGEFTRIYDALGSSNASCSVVHEFLNKPAFSNHVLRTPIRFENVIVAHRCRVNKPRIVIFLSLSFSGSSVLFKCSFILCKFFAIDPPRYYRN